MLHISLLFLFHMKASHAFQSRSSTICNTNALRLPLPSKRWIPTVRMPPPTTTLLFSSSTNDFGRSPELWPPTGGDGNIDLRDSFPNGAIPKLGDETATSSLSATATTAKSTSAKTAAGICLALLFRGQIPPLDILLVTILSGYFLIIARANPQFLLHGSNPTTTRKNNNNSVLVDNPLGYAWTQSVGYRRWLQTGFGLGLVGPLMLVLLLSTTTSACSSRGAARCAFGIAGQALTEAVVRKTTTFLPLRILVPVAYNVVRMGQLWQWMMPTSAGVTATATAASKWSACLAAGTGWFDRSLAILNFAYWGCNLLGFLIPVGVVRYLRAHVVAVEAESIALKEGVDLGLSPYNPNGSAAAGTSKTRLTP